MVEATLSQVLPRVLFSRTGNTDVNESRAMKDLPGIQGGLGNPGPAKGGLNLYLSEGNHP